VSFFVETERARAKSPADQKVVGISREIAERESSIHVHRESDQRNCSGGTSRRPGNPRAENPCADSLKKWLNNGSENEGPISPSHPSKGYRNKQTNGSRQGFIQGSRRELHCFLQKSKMLHRNTSEED